MANESLLCLEKRCFLVISLDFVVIFCVGMNGNVCGSCMMRSDEAFREDELVLRSAAAAFVNCSLVPRSPLTWPALARLVEREKWIFRQVPEEPHLT